MKPSFHFIPAWIVTLLCTISLLQSNTTRAAVTKTELAGRALTVYPFFEYVKAINEDKGVQIAIDPTRFPSIVGLNCDIYIVAAKGTIGWDASNTLTDVSVGGKMSFTFSGANIQGNTVTIANAGELSANAGLGLGVGYDVIIDVNKNGLLDDNDFIDGRNNEAGFYRVHNTAAPGPKTVTELDYNINTMVASSYGIPAGLEAENLFFPTDVTGVMAATGKKLPIIIVSHGTGHQYSWYDHIGMHLASYGYVVMSHENNTNAGSVSASVTTLAHTDAFIDRINAAAIPGAEALAGNIDADRIVWIGHSRGAEGVAIAYDKLFDVSYTTVNYSIGDIKLISSMLPTDWYGTDIADPHNANYHLWTASGDNDVSGCAQCAPGYPYQLCRTFHLHGRATGNRQSTIVQGTGHGWFHNGGGSGVVDGPCQIGQSNTHKILLGHLLPLVKRYVEDNIPSLDFLTRQYESFRPIGVPDEPCIVVSHEYLDASSNTPGNPQKTVMIDDYQTNTATNVSSSGAGVNFDVQNVTEGLLNDTNADFTWTAADPFNGATQGGSTDGYTMRNDVSRGVVFDWTNSNRFYEWIIPVAERNFTNNLYLSFRGAQGTKHPNTIAQLGDLTFKVTLRDGQGTPVTSSISIGAFGGGFEEPYQRQGGWHNEMETIRIRLTDFLNNGSGLDLSNIVAIRLDFGPAHGSSAGRIVLDEIMLTNDRALYDANANGDPHIKTVNGTYYDFHGAGEYTLLRDGADFEIQVRQTPVTTAAPITNGYTGLRSCVAVNTALAARVGAHRISYQPDGPVQEQATRMRLRVDGVLKDINTLGTINLGGSARISKLGTNNGIEVHFPNGTTLVVTQNWWGSNNIVFLNVNVLNTPATEGIAGLIEPGQWLPVLSDGTRLGPKPANLSVRYTQLNKKFSDSWRITNASSLFDYAAGTNTSTFTNTLWPVENADTCKLPSQAIAIIPINKEEAARACGRLLDKEARNNCIADVMVTGDLTFAKSYLEVQQLELAGTKTDIYPERRIIRSGDTAIFVAVVKRMVTGLALQTSNRKVSVSPGAVQFYINDRPVMRPFLVNSNGEARILIPGLKAGEYRVHAVFTPTKAGGANLASRSGELVYAIKN